MLGGAYNIIPRMPNEDDLDPAKVEARHNRIIAIHHAKIIFFSAAIVALIIYGFWSGDIRVVPT